MKIGDTALIGCKGLWCHGKAVTVTKLLREFDTECFAFDFTWPSGETIGYALPISWAWVLREERQLA